MEQVSTQSPLQSCYFASFGITGLKAGLLLQVFSGILKAFAALVWMFCIVDRLGRRTALYFSFPCSICMWYIGAYIKIAKPGLRVANGDTHQDAGGKQHKQCYIFGRYFTALVGMVHPGLSTLRYSVKK